MRRILTQMGAVAGVLLLAMGVPSKQASADDAQAGAQLVPIATPAARYPPQMARACRSGQAHFEFEVGADGRVVDVVIKDVSEPALEGPVRHTVRTQWRFQALPPWQGHVRAASSMQFEPEADCRPPPPASE